MKSSFALLFLMILTGKAIAGVGLQLKLLHPDHYYDSARQETYMNRDSVLVDSQASSPTYLEYYASKWWEIDFKYYVINRPVAPYDTTIELPWTVINTSYSALRSSFSAMETKFGTFHLVELEPESYDSTANGSKSYDIVFDNYVCVDSVLADLRLFPDVDSTYGIQDIAFGSYPAWADGIPNDRSLVPGILATSISPDPDPFYPSVWPNLASNWHSRGWGWADYSIHCPMAWEITMGKSNVVIADHDWWSGSAESYPHLDIVYRKTATPNGNWLLFSPTASPGDPQFPGGGGVKLS